MGYERVLTSERCRDEPEISYLQECIYGGGLVALLKDPCAYSLRRSEHSRIGGKKEAFI